MRIYLSLAMLALASPAVAAQSPTRLHGVPIVGTITMNPGGAVYSEGWVKYTTVNAKGVSVTCWGPVENKYGNPNNSVVEWKRCILDADPEMKRPADLR
jgi:hypothetical protein